jgi:hypothetical protein
MVVRRRDSHIFLKIDTDGSEVVRLAGRPLPSARFLVLILARG